MMLMTPKRRRDDGGEGKPGRENDENGRADAQGGRAPARGPGEAQDKARRFALERPNGFVTNRAFGYGRHEPGVAHDSVRGRFAVDLDPPSRTAKATFLTRAYVRDAEAESALAGRVLKWAYSACTHCDVLRAKARRKEGKSRARARESSSQSTTQRS